MSIIKDLLTALVKPVVSNIFDKDIITPDDPGSWENQNVFNWEALTLDNWEDFGN